MQSTDTFISKNQLELCQDLIAVTNRRLCPRPFLEQIERVCQIHPKALILREKDLTKELYLQLASKVFPICKEYEVPFIPHFYPSVAEKIGSDKIHLPLPLLRENPEIVHYFQTVGTSVHSVEDALEAENLGASYVTAGHIYATDCKKGVPPRGLDFLKEVCQAVQLPVYGIGGVKIDAVQLAELKHAGAVGGCVMSGMMQI